MPERPLHRQATSTAGMAEYTVADARYCFPLPEGYTEPQAAPLLCAGPDRLPRAADVRGGAAARPLRLRRLRPHPRPGRPLAGTAACSPSRGPATRPRRRSRGSSAPSGRAAPSEAPPRAAGRGDHLRPRRTRSCRSALRALAPGGTVVCGGIHMSDIPSFPYEHPLGGADAALRREPHRVPTASRCWRSPPGSRQDARQQLSPRAGRAGRSRICAPGASPARPCSALCGPTRPWRSSSRARGRARARLERQATAREAGKLELDPRPALGARTRPTPTRRGPRRSRARSPARGRCRPRRGRAPESVRWKRSKTRSRCSAGIPGPSSSTTKRSARRERPRRVMRTSPARAAVCSIALATRLRSAWASAVGVGRGACRAGRRRARSGGRRAGSCRPTAPRTNAASSIGSTRRNSRCSVFASSSRSSTRRLIRAISASTSRSTRRTSSADGFGWARQHLELAADHRQRRAQLVRGVGDERALTGERLGQPVEHVVEGVGEHRDLVALAAGLVDPRGAGRPHPRARRRRPSGAAAGTRASPIR